MLDGFIREGHIVQACGRDASMIELLSDLNPEPHGFAQVDVSNDEAVAAWASVVIERCGPPDFLINNAGVINANAPLWTIKAAEFDRVIDVNIKAPYCATKFAIEGMTLALAQELPPGMAAIPLNPGVIDTDMLRSCFGDNAVSYPSPSRWAERAVPFILALSARENGHSATVE